LTNGIGCALVPAGRLGRLLGGKNFHEVFREIIKFITGIYVAMERRTVELGQYIHVPELGIETVADRDIHQSVFAGQRYRRFRTILGQREQACSRSSAHDDGECFILEGRAVHCLGRSLSDVVFGLTHLASGQFLCHDGFYLCAG
jgi:hypothetical protein